MHPVRSLRYFRAAVTIRGMGPAGRPGVLTGGRGRNWSPLRTGFEVGEEHFRYRPWVSINPAGAGPARERAALSRRHLGGHVRHQRGDVESEY